MFRIALQRTSLRAAPTYRRSFVSTVLLTKPWESETVSELKREARRRGLSQYVQRGSREFHSPRPRQGTKATLVTRLKKDDERKSMTPAPTVSANVPRQVRHASTAEVPGIPSTSEPPPLSKFPREFFKVALPDLSQPDPETPIQIPLLPDLWGASAPKVQSSADFDAGASAPKMVAVAGSVTHHGGGPTHNLFSSDEEAYTAETAPARSEDQSVWRDFADDLSLPTSFKPSKVAGQAFDVAAKTETSGEKSYSRTLDSDEVRGLWVLLGLLAGSWVAAGVFKPSSAYAQKVEEVTEHAAEKVKGGH
ncbi:uncharacterized protein B0H18DRAFT_1182347 [Fomitopsis serialis]|uniref:uncharacterized protein n=1 Tax=Fomitopsis serialis TaxID=139415 RepID=UPI002007FF13|nr:uncharacterized protein B0H18DRAFT_1182347 [Neoantrodia serialis]KAH9934992.1 hypothetical protein B0H18DRAFT_1182347 [Neoantrodia serialis]